MEREVRARPLGGGEVRNLFNDLVVRVFPRRGQSLSQKLKKWTNKTSVNG